MSADKEYYRAAMRMLKAFDSPSMVAKLTSPGPDLLNELSELLREPPTPATAKPFLTAADIIMLREMRIKL